MGTDNYDRAAFDLKNRPLCIYAGLGTRLLSLNCIGTDKKTTQTKTKCNAKGHQGRIEPAPLRSCITFLAFLKFLTEVLLSIREQCCSQGPRGGLWGLSKDFGRGAQ